MKIAGVDPSTLSAEEVLVLPRGDQRIVFRARGLSDMDTFEKLCPEPTPPGKLTKDGWSPDADDVGYKEVLAQYRKQRMAYIVIQSLAPSEIEWDTVQVDNPLTWINWESDLKQAGLSQVEINRVMTLAMEANCLSEAKLQRARELFLRDRPPVPAT